ncbi:MAG: VOC family protein [Kiritimatiellae bacterium]|jgi:catechol 2,3-dioxygenase-like lactoylglutathione lyase family enzyme|nr:VOC family protein [Kiritimatiellia bacterium]
MKIEHFALNVAEPVAMAAWYVDNLGFKVARHMDEPPCTHFLEDSSGTGMLEIYNNPPDEVPVYADMNPLQVHVALVSGDPEEDKSTLIAAGATLVDEMHLDDGSHLVMLRDPWGLAVQLCKRGVPICA